MRTPARLALVLGMVTIATGLLGSAASADHVRAIAEVSVADHEKLENGYLLSVKLRGSDGRPVNSATVRFYASVEIFGSREMLIASALTDGQGNASVPYLPARLGKHEIMVRFPGRDHIAPADARHEFEATVAAAPYRQPVPALATFSAAVPYGAGFVVLAVWALIAFAFFGTLRGVLEGARPQIIRKGDTA